MVAAAPLAAAFLVWPGGKRLATSLARAASTSAATPSCHGCGSGLASTIRAINGPSGPMISSHPFFASMLANQCDRNVFSLITPSSLTVCEELRPLVTTDRAGVSSLVLLPRDRDNAAPTIPKPRFVASPLHTGQYASSSRLAGLRACRRIVAPISREEHWRGREHRWVGVTRCAELRLHGDGDRRRIGAAVGAGHRELERRQSDRCGRRREARGVSVGEQLDRATTRRAHAEDGSHV